MPAAGGGGGVASAFSGTHLQEAGVDEDDLLKTDGSFVYALHSAYASAYPSAGEVVPARLEARRILQDGSLGTAASVALDSQAVVRGMYLAEDAGRVAVLGSKQGQVALDVFDVTGGAPPAHAMQVLIDGSLISTRRIGNVLYVASTWSPDLSRYWSPPGTPEPQVEATLAELNASALLPTIRVGGAPARPLVEEQDCQLQPASASRSLQLTTLTAIDLSTPALERRSRCFVGNGDTLYMSTAAVYVATSRNYWLAADVMPAALPEQATTDIHKFTLQGLQLAYRGSAEITGHLGWDRQKMPYRMSEHQGDLRVVTYTGTTGWTGVADATLARQTPASPATLTVLRESAPAGRLVRVATLPNARRPAPLGHEGEQVYAVQFAGPLAYIVTFRRTDPLYVLDLSDPADPRATGELAIPGFSDYLFPLANGKLLGVGKDATDEGLLQGLKIALFDVSDPALPLLLSSRSLGERGSSSALDYTRHGINIFRDGGQARIALPVRLVETVSGEPRYTRQGLARYVVDTAAGTLAERAMLVATQFDGSSADTDRFAQFHLAGERSVQSARATYYLSGGEVRHIAEP
ncbi:MAG TPA: beta-propeller domain-containing protein [Burkholderiaceae bacterium]|nr:beta-propeller domain-containing protein [Burkholderiaceae bacterium]